MEKMKKLGKDGFLKFFPRFTCSYAPMNYSRNQYYLAQRSPNNLNQNGEKLWAELWMVGKEL